MVFSNGYIENPFDDSRIDDRDLYAVRGSLRFEPTPDMVLDIIGYYFREDDNRSRIQKQLFNRDATAILGCSPDRLEFETTSGNATLGAALPSRQLLAVRAGQRTDPTERRSGSLVFARVRPESVRERRHHRPVSDRSELEPVHQCPLPSSRAATA
ncbi:hypothetical protein [Novosphingopyxis sp.]|uniref:hypothetical protein n=1 Tax=Novosphingopyxis sp. TaxID=2709690 RepID=UPI003B58F571